jgi:uncharacterized protein YpiB (UPF0302 family)
MIALEFKSSNRSLLAMAHIQRGAVILEHLEAEMKRVEELHRLIDAALDERNEAAFMALTAELNRLKGGRMDV